MAEMTPQKALEILEMFLHKQCDLQRTKFAYSDIEVYCAVSMAKHALEKPIPEITEQEKTLTLAFGKDGKARVLNEDYVIYCADEETFEKVKEAVEKQTPKRPNKIGYPIDSDTDPLVYGYCPCCNTHRDSSKGFCDNCGQALDWSDTE